MEASLHAVTEAQTVAIIIDQLKSRCGGWVVTHNLDHLRRIHKDLYFRELCSSADLVVADGMPLIWASKLAGEPLPGRVAGSNLIFSLSAAAAREGFSIYLLGGNPGSADAAARRLSSLYPELRVAGTACPNPGFEHDESAWSALKNALTRAQPDIVFVGLGSPKQEQFISRMRPQLPRAWWLGVGISFSFVCGEVRRAPQWVQSLGFEWLHRLMQEPERLGRRYVCQGLPFAFLLLLHSLRRRFRSSRQRSAEDP